MNVYFIQAKQGGAIKIGCSNSPRARLRSIATSSPSPIELICFVPGGYDDERRLHYMFADQRIHGEWFEPNKALLTMVASCEATGELPEIPNPVVNKPPNSFVNSYAEAMKNNPLVAALARHEGNYSALARTLGVSRQRLQHWLNAGTPIPAELVLNAEKALGVSRHILRADIYPIEDEGKE